MPSRSLHASFRPCWKRFSPKTPPAVKSGMPSSPCSRACSDSRLDQNALARSRRLRYKDEEIEGQARARGGIERRRSQRAGGPTHTPDEMKAS